VTRIRIVAIAVAAVVGAGAISYAAVRRHELAPRHTQQCDNARMDSAFIVDWMLSQGRLNREAARRAYDYVLLEQRQCLLFTAPIQLSCSDDGCRAASLLAGQLVMR
jgi:hypothetical protein